MKLKKCSYLIILLLTFIVGINNSYAIDIMTVTKAELKYKQNDNDSEIIIMQIDNDKEEDEICKELFGRKENPKSIRYFVNDILKYPKIIVPILVILLGMLDFGKAVIASKEDEMRKAQATFIKRVLIGIVIFFVPMILDIIMHFTDLVLGYTTCGI